VSVSATTLRKLALLGLDAEQMAGVLDILADGVEAEEARKTAQRERTRKARAKQRDATVTLPTRDSNSDDTRGGVTRVEDKTSTTKIEPQKENKTPRAALEAVLDAERADAVLAHRQRIRKPLTEHAAKLLAGKFAKCPDPNAAADTMIGNGWTGFEPEWMARPAARGSPPQKPRGMQGMFSEMREVLEDGQTDDGRGHKPSGATVLSLPYSRTG
jgi:hypothetical protein